MNDHLQVEDIASLAGHLADLNSVPSIASFVRGSTSILVPL